MAIPNERASVPDKDKEEWPEVAVIVLNWNNYEDTAECLESLERVRYPNYRVIVVDNGSTDGSRQRLSEEFKWCEFTFNKKNLGYSAGNKVGVNKALSYGADYILILNNDVIVDDRFLTPLVETAERNEKVAAVDGIMYDTSENIWSAGGEIPLLFLLGLSTWTKSFLWTEPKKVNEEYKTGFIGGGSVMFSPEFIVQESAISEEYFFGMEDVEWSYRAQKNGWNLFIDPGSKLIHKKSSTIEKQFVPSSFSSYNGTRNMLKFAERNFNIARQYQYYIFVTFMKIYNLTNMIFAVKPIGAGEDGGNRDDAIGGTTIRDRAYYNLLAIYDHFLNNPHKPPNYFRR